MITVDTNVLARAILDDDEIQSPLAQKKINKLLATEGIYVSAFTILELAWLMKMKKKSRQEIYEVFSHFLNAKSTEVGHRAIVERALELYRKGKVSFADCMILADSNENSSSGVVTFDHDFAQYDNVQLIAKK
ncbi:MAG: type II toxin-antitoxin system VapC family toxin [Bdellovibrionota bacterium]